MLGRLPSPHSVCSLSRLRGRDREGARNEIRACVPPPHPSPVNGGGSRPSLPRARDPQDEAAARVPFASPGPSPRYRSSRRKGQTSLVLFADRDNVVLNPEERDEYYHFGQDRWLSLLKASAETVSLKDIRSEERRVGEKTRALSRARQVTSKART